jgi:hypothetical protein
MGHIGSFSLEELTKNDEAVVAATVAAQFHGCKSIEMFDALEKVTFGNRFRVYLTEIVIKSNLTMVLIFWQIHCRLKPKPRPTILFPSLLNKAILPVSTNPFL